MSGPEDLQTEETKSDYFWGYCNMSTVKGLFCAGDASGASSHKFSSGSHAEGRIAAKAAVKFVVEEQHPARARRRRPGSPQGGNSCPARPVRAIQERHGPIPKSTRNYIKPRMFMFRLQKIMDEYAGGVTAQFTTNEALLKRALELLAFLKEDSEPNWRRPISTS